MATSCLAAGLRLHGAICAARARLAALNVSVLLSACACRRLEVSIKDPGISEASATDAENDCPFGKFVDLALPPGPGLSPFADNPGHEYDRRYDQGNL